MFARQVLQLLHPPLSALLLVLISSHWAWGASPELSPFRAAYTLSRAGVSVGTVLRTLRRESNGTYTYESQSQSTGMMSVFLKDRILERSHWQVVNDTVRSLSYVYERSGGSKHRNVRLAFDWQARTVTNDVDGDAWKMPVPDGAMDKLLYQIAVMRDLRAGKEKLAYEVADGGKLKTYAFDIEGDDFIETALGTLKTTRVTRNRDDRVTTIWCAVDYQYLPVQIEQFEENHGLLRLTIQSLEGITPTPSATSP